MVECKPRRWRGKLPNPAGGGTGLDACHAESVIAGFPAVSVYVYILHSEKLDLYYTGLSINPDFRLKQHRRGESHWSSRASDWRQIFLETCSDKKSARDLEKRIKAQGAARFLTRKSNDWTQDF